MNEIVFRRVLRGVAIAIALAGVVDPASTTNRSVKAVVEVSALDSARDAGLADRISKALTKQFTVSREPIAAASAAVLVGDRLPGAGDEYPAPTFVVAPDSSAPEVSIERVVVPAVSPADARVPVTARMSIRGGAARSLEVTLRAGAAVADHVMRRLGATDTSIAISLSFVPITVGATPVHVTATMDGVRGPAVADAATNVRDTRWAVLFFDPRPSWTSTFVRRAVERDPRFVVTSRVVTSRRVSTDAGRPPANLDDLAALALFDAVVVGAPEGLSAADVAGLDAFMRRRGGSVFLLLDQRVAGPYDRLMNVPAWTASDTSSSSLATAGRDTAALRATDLAFPTTLPAGATTIAGGAKPVVWETPLGAGRLLVSGALDAWRFRDPSMSGFDRFWRNVVAGAANASPPAVSVALSSAVAAPGEVVRVRATIRDVALQPTFAHGSDSRTLRASIAATLEPERSQAGAPTIPTAIHLWPSADAGQFSGVVRASRTPGVYDVAVTSEGMTALAPFVVATDVRQAAPSTRTLLAAWATAHGGGGRLLAAGEMARLSSLLNAAIRPPARLERWHPLRSAWWIVPFVLALSGEWLLRRRRGLP